MNSALSEQVWVTKKGSVYHKDDPRHDPKHRGRHAIRQAEVMTREEAKRLGRVSCDKCYGRWEPRD